jgi:2-polyprenyl-6-methoxyphenol hydroxylase-like FAD-dependent oxidoreductase
LPSHIITVPSFFFFFAATQLSLPLYHCAGKYTIKYNNPAAGKVEEMQVDYIIGADGANSRVAKAIDAGARVWHVLCVSSLLTHAHTRAEIC